MHTRGKGGNSLEKQRIPPRRGKECVPWMGCKTGECVEHTLCSVKKNRLGTYSYGNILLKCVL